MQYACVARTESEARCRRILEVDNFNPDSCRCAQHQGALLAPSPDVVLVKFRVNQNWKEELTEVGVDFRNSDFGSRDRKHIDQAHSIGRQAFRIREATPDSGTPVFGPDKAGLQGICPLPGIRPHPEHGYKLTMVFLEPTRENHGMYSLVLILDKNGRRADVSQELVDKIVEFVSPPWGHCHVWANPPRVNDGKIIHTLNFSHRLPGKKPALLLLFNSGLWAVKPWE